MNQNDLSPYKITIKNTNENEIVQINSDSSVDELIENMLKVSQTDKEKLASDFLIRFDRETMGFNLAPKEEFINGKIDLDKLVHPFFSDLPETGPNKEILNISSDEKLILFSPHPDDEVLGGCALLSKCFQEKINIKVVYMTSGQVAGGETTRQKESKEGIKKLNGGEEHLIFYNFPFYKRPDKEVKEDDHEIAREILRKFNPDTVFVCADLYDPHRTHKKCYEILTKLLFEEKEFANVKVFYYYSVWYWPQEKEYSHILPYDFETYKLKVYAMLEHKSQIETNYMGTDPRPFYQRATARDGKFGKLHGHNFSEVYYKVDKKN